MICITEKLDKAVNHDTLETAIRKAAEEIGLKIKEEASEKNGCAQTNFYLKKHFHPTIEVKTYNRGNPIGFYCVYVDDFFGFESKKAVETYVEKVRDYLDKHEQNLNINSF